MSEASHRFKAQQAYLEAGAQTSIIQNLSYFEHLAEPMAEFLQILAEQYDYPQLAEEILRSSSLRASNKGTANV